MVKNIYLEVKARKGRPNNQTIKHIDKQKDRQSTQILIHLDELLYDKTFLQRSYPNIFLSS